MRFLGDAQLPARLARLLGDSGHDALHTSALPGGNRTTDAHITFPTAARVRIRSDGSAVVQTAAQDVRTGIYTILTQVAGDALGVDAPRHRLPNRRQRDRDGRARAEQPATARRPRGLGQRDHRSPATG